MSSCRCFPSGLLLLLLLALSGCGHAEAPLARGPSRPALVRLEKLSIQGSAGTRIDSPHYTIYSTIPDPLSLQRVADVMEGALAEYRTLAPDVPLTKRPMECYLFDTRQQWAAFTKAHTGEDAAIYLRVNRGGYTVGDWYVAYWIGDIATYSVAAHEGWHQFVARHLKGRLPPFLEEGLACLCEQVQWQGELPRWDLAVNGARLGSLRSAAAGHQLYPLSQLVRMHAGQVVGKPNAKIEAFYAESWAYARFLHDAEGGRYRPALRRMLADAGRGALFADTSRELSDGPLWDPSSAKPMLEHYLGASLARQEEAFRRYIDQLVSDIPPDSGG
ncbi:MAG TPA: hypothetical protein VGI81_04990 [Tepidisphaeraceae bacterium]|jgi:hypothetical protein